MDAVVAVAAVQAAPEAVAVAAASAVDGIALKGLKERARKVEASRPGAEAVEPNFFFRSSATPDDPRYDDQYFFGQIGAPGAWNDTEGEGIRICVVDYGNPEFSNKVVAEKDVVGEVHDGYAEDDTGHGTHVAGIAVTETDNGARTAGVGWPVETGHREGHTQRQRRLRRLERGSGPGAQLLPERRRRLGRQHEHRRTAVGGGGGGSRRRQLNGHNPRRFSREPGYVRDGLSRRLSGCYRNRRHRP